VVESEDFTDEYTDEQSKLMKLKKLMMDRSIGSDTEESVRSNLQAFTLNSALEQVGGFGRF
jgi:hypothetical protein